MYWELEISEQKQDGEQQYPFHRQKEDERCKKFFIPRGIKHDGVHHGVEEKLQKEIACHDEEYHAQQEMFGGEDERVIDRREHIEIVKQGAGEAGDDREDDLDIDLVARLLHGVLTFLHIEEILDLPPDEA